MRYLSVCSGIEAASVAWYPLGWQAAAFSEIEPFPCSVLAHRFPNVPNLGDMTKHENWKDRTGPIDILVGGTPCQAFSVAGLRKGLADPRGNLTLTFLAIAAQYLPRWIVWENVPGVLSDRTGAFGSFVGGLAELGYGWAYKICDAQYYGVAQRRRRVFVVGHLGDWSRAASVLFEREGLQGHPPPSRTSRQNVAPTISARTKGGGGLGTDFELDGGLIPEVAGPMSENGGTDKKHGFGMGQQDWENGYCVPAVAGCLQERDSKGADSDTKPGHLIPVAFKPSHFTRGKDGAPSEVVPPLSADADKGDQDIVVMAQQGLTTERDTFMLQGINREMQDVRTYEADANSILSTLREQVGEEAFAEWGFRVLNSLQSPEVLRVWLHGESLRCASEPFRHWAVNGSVSWPKGADWNALRQVWENGPDGRTPQGRGLAKQLCIQLGDRVQELSQPDSQEQGKVQRLRKACEGAGALRQALSAIQEVRRPVNVQAKPAFANYQVRRLTVRETERLQGFPDDWTLVPHRGKPAADGPRYKAIGNSMAVPVMRWIGKRIQMVDGLNPRG